jgi:hypothetical protein
MKTRQMILFSVTAAAFCSIAAGADSRNSTALTPDTVWTDPGEIGLKDLYYGSGSEARKPRGRFLFIREDNSGSNAKFIVRDENGDEWKVKIGDEARSETAATRFLWAMGFYTDETYLLPVFHVDLMPRLKRGNRLLQPDRSMRNARLERIPKDREKSASWRWHNNPMRGTREMNGLRVMMALMNNWDLKNNNNAIYSAKDGGQPDGPDSIYVVSDVGATFATTGQTMPSRKGDLDAFTESRFITKVGSDYVDFSTPSLPPVITVFALPYYMDRVQMLTIGRRIPREDVRWIAGLLMQLKPEQIRRAFEGAGYHPFEVEQLAEAMERRIAQLSEI